MSVPVALGIAAAVCLAVFLATKELASSTRSGPSLRIAKFVNVGIVPLAIAFAVIAATKIVEALA
jgi:hypothetical protein